MPDESLLTHKRVKVYAERDCALRAHEYVVVAFDRETGEETGAFTFYVSDDGKRIRIGALLDASKMGAALGR